ncbi:hypothetical protein FSP39_004471 [Pinctada imbricata]|uniref:VWFD domain-containing protein n=1 Tax=Pinctada imbricata TaxID=66713 RepID=A0AA88YAA9_PINIB|nr:hypothetical protein FSP39_004471 [Pinctada imbricata]
MINSCDFNSKAMTCEDPNMEYLSSGLACPATCLEPKPTSCDLEPTEGCFCKKGFVMSDGKCVRETECGCIDNNGEYFPIGAKKDSGDCSSSYMCKQVKKGQKPRLVRIPSKRKCAKFASCRLNEEGERACVCKKGYVGDGYTQCKKEKSCLCMASGDPHYKTYDGNIIHFMGSCRYTLTKSTKNGDACAFNVEVKNEHRGQNTRVSYTRYVDVQIYGLSVRLLPKGKVLVNGKRKYLPIMENKGVFKVFKSGRYVQVWTGCGIKVNFDGRHSVSVVVPSKYENNMIGLCGNCNGNKIDDMSTKDGTDVSKMKNRYSLVGESFMVNDKNSPERCITVEAPPTSCSKKLEKSIPTLDFCGAILDKKGVFRECVKAFPELAQEFYDSCKFDVCSLEEDPTMFATAKCTSLEAFAEECAENGIALQWRSSKMCPMKCDDPNMEFLYNGPGCSPSCANPNPNQNCPLEPREGCFCKKGYVLSDGECVKETDCGCTNSHKDYFPIGTKFTTEDCRRTLECQRQKGKAPKFVEIAKQKKCNKKASCDYDENGEKKCLCKKGYFGDGIKSCKPLCRGKYKCHEKAFCRRGKCKCAQGYFGDGIKSCDRLCTCSASGDPHYRTYDGQMIHFMGNCKYTMTKSLVTNDKCSFNVEVKNEHRGSNRRVTYTRMVDLHIYNRTIRLAKDGKIYVDGERKVLPVYENDGEISIFPSGRFVQVVTACNVVLRYDGKSVVRVGVPYRYRGMMTGLCGNCNRKKDDYRTKEGKDVRRSKKKYSLIGRSYQVPDDSDKPQKSCNTEEDEVKCTRQMNKVASQIDHCGFMDFARRDKSPFKICLAIKRNFAIQMYESCKYDVCSYYNNEEERRNVVCRAFENLDAECVELGLSFNWRTDQFCPLKCGANQVYKSYMNGCPATCANPKAEENCPVKSTEGCACLPGFLLSGTECVKKEECGCRLKNGDYLPVNATKESSDCATTWVCTLTENGPQLLKARSGQRCHRNAECSRIDGVQQCVCKDGFFGDGIKQCNVEVKNRRQNKNAKVSFTRIVDVKVPGTHVRLHQKRRLTVNNQNAFTPYTSEESKLHVANRGRFIVVTTACGLVVTFDGKHSISVTIPKSLGRSVHGICGNCDGRKNDMRTKNGKDVSKSKNKYSIIGDSYKVFDDLSKNSKKCKTKHVDFTCSTFWLRKIATNSYCGMIKDKNGPFAECIDADNNLSDQFFKSCQDDVCSFDSKDDVAREMACMALESFAETCLARGYGKVIWRSKDFCPLTCRKNEQYNPAIVDCPATCQHPEGPEICNVAPQEGCECKEGFVLSGNQCVREEDCGCWFKDEYYPINATGPLTNCDLIQTCVKVGGRNEMQIKQRVLNCHQYAQCRNWDGEYKCVCDIGYTGDGEKECTGSPCTVTTTHSSCGSTTQLRGDCTFESDFVSKCTYSVTTQSRGGVIKASSIIKGKLVLLEAGKSVDECVQIQNQGPSVIIRDNVCERCTVDFVRNIVSGDTCSGM